MHGDGLSKGQIDRAGELLRQSRLPGSRFDRSEIEDATRVLANAIRSRSFFG